MKLAGSDEGRLAMGDASVGNASPTESSKTDNPPPSPCLDNEYNEDNVTPRQQWSPVHTVGGGRGGHPQHTRDYNRGSACAGTFAGAGGKLRDHYPGKGGKGREEQQQAPKGGSTSQALYQKPRAPPASRPDSPVTRVDLECLDLSALALGEEGGPMALHLGSRDGAGRGGGGGAGISSINVGGGGRSSSELLNRGAFRSEPGPVGPEGRPRSLGGRPSRVHALFVKPGQVGAGPASPPSSYSTHSESGFASPTARLASPFAGGLWSCWSGREPPFQHQLQQYHQAGRVKKGKWKRGKAIGVGSCGNVYLGMNEDTGELMAVKEITLETKDRLLTSLYNEIQVMHKLVHPHIVGYLGAELQDHKRRLCIFQEWVPAGSLHSLLGQFGALSDAMTRKYTRQVLDGLKYLHANRVIHRDVKSKNILVDDRGNVKLADFGCALVLKDDTGDGVEMSMKGTPLFMAPEMLLKRKCGKRVDVWSLGCAVLEMVTTRPPWADTFKHPVEIIEHFTDNPGPPPLPDDLSQSLRSFLLACFTWDAWKRPTSHELCGHTYLRTPRPSEDFGGGGSGSGSGSPGADDDTEIPLEAMGRAPFMTRMRRCSSATLPELLSRPHAFGGGGGGGGTTTDGLAPFGTAPSGILRPPSPRYGPGGAGNKRTPTRRRVCTDVGAHAAAMPPPETAVATGAMELVRRASMSSISSGRSPPVSPDNERPRRPGRGCSPGRCCSSTGMAWTQQQQQQLQQLQQQLQQQPHHLQGDDGGGAGGQARLGSGPILPARQKSLGDGLDGFGSRVGAGVHSGGRTGRTDSDVSLTSTVAYAGAPAAAAVAAAAASAAGIEGVRKVAPTPIAPPVVRELLLGALDHQAGARGATMGGFQHHHHYHATAARDTPPPTVRRLGLRRSVSANGACGIRGLMREQEHQRSAKGTDAGGDGAGEWKAERGMSDASSGGAGGDGGGGGGGGLVSRRLSEEDE